MKPFKSARVAVVIAIAATGLSAFGSSLAPSAFAQSEGPPQESSQAPTIVTPVPLSTPTEAPAEAPTPEPTAEPATTAAPTTTDEIKPLTVDQGEMWSPSATTSKIGANLNVTTRVDAPYTFNPASAQYNLYNPNIGYQGWQAVSSSTLSNSNSRIVMTATLPANTPAGWQILFRATSSDGSTTTTSPLYSLSTGLYLPVTMKDSVSSVLPFNLTPFAGVNISCSQALGPLAPGGRYTALASTVEGWYYAVVLQPNSNIVVSLTNFTVAGQLQIFVPQSGGGCANLTPQPQAFAANPNPVVTLNNVPAGVVYFRVVISPGLPPNSAYTIGWTFNTTTIGPFANNYTPCTAAPIVPNLNYTAFADNQWDFFALDLPVQGTILVTVTNFPVANAQLQIRGPLLDNNCSPTSSTQTLEFGVLQPNQTLTLIEGGLSPGRYYARVNLPTSTPPSPPPPYTISWGYVQGTVTGTWNPNFTTNPVPYQPDVCLNTSPGGSCTYYWNGMGNNDSQGFAPVTAILMQIVAVTNLVGCGPGNTGTVLPGGFANNFANVGTTAPSGLKTFTFPSSGGYNVNIRVQRQGRADYNDGKPLKVGCGLVTLKEYMQVSKDLSFDVPKVKSGDPMPLILPDP